MLTIANYEDLYMPTDTKGKELVNATFVKVPAKPKGNGLETLFKYKDGLKVFAVWILLLEATTSQKKGTRGVLCNHKDQPASVKEVAKSILLGKQLKFVKYSIGVLTELGWVLDDGKDGESVQGTLFVHPKSSVEKSSVEKSSVADNPPTLEQINKYIQEKHLNIDGFKFLRYYTEAKWIKANSEPVRNWKLTLLSWDDSNGSKAAQTSKPSNDAPELGPPVKSAYRLKYEAKVKRLKAAGKYKPGMKIEV